MALIIFIFIISILVIVHEFGHFFVAQRLGVGVESFSVGFGPPIFKHKFRNFEFFIRIIPLGGYVKLTGDSVRECKGEKNEFYSQPVGKRSLIVGAGPLFNYLLAWFSFCIIFVGGFIVPSTRVGELLEGYPAEEAGIKPRDIILKIEDKKVKTWQEMAEFIHNLKKEKVRVTVLRGKREMEFIIKLKRKEVRDFLGRKRTFSFIGIAPSEEMVKLRYSFPESLLRATTYFFHLTFMILQSIGYILIGVLPLKESVTGPLGIYYVTREVASIGLGAILHLLGVLSLSLSIFNLLPLPVLDGGHILLFLIEKIRRKTLSERAEDLINQVGFVLIITLIFLVLYNDILRFGTKIIGGG